MTAREDVDRATVRTKKISDALEYRWLERYDEGREEWSFFAVKVKWNVDDNFDMKIKVVKDFTTREEGLSWIDDKELELLCETKQ